MQVAIQALPALVEHINEARRQLRATDEVLAKLLSDESILESPLRECLRCGHRWYGTRGIIPPKQCPNCSSTGWDTPPTRATHRRPGDRRGDASQRRELSKLGRQSPASIRRMQPARQTPIPSPDPLNRRI